MKKRAIGIAGVFATPFALYLLFSVLSSGFGLHSLSIVVSQSMIPTMMGFGMAVTMVSGLMDFSIGARVIFAATVSAIGAQYFGIAGFLAGALLGGIIGAAVLAALYRILRIPSLVVSFGFVILIEVATYKLSTYFGNIGNIRVPKEVYSIAIFPYNLLWVAGAAVICYMALYRTKTGIQLVAVGNNEELAGSVGISTKALKTKAYLLSGLFCTIGGILQISYSGSITVMVNMQSISMIFKPMMGVMMAVFALRRLWNNIPVAILIAEICIAIIFNGLIAVGFPDSVQNIALGIFLYIVLAVSENTPRILEASRRAGVRKRHRPADSACPTGNS